VLISVGATRVVCAATLEETVPGFMRGQGRGWVTAEYSMLPRATLTRTPREVAKGRPWERTLVLDCDVLLADGGTRTASICGGFVALALALQRLVEAGTLARLPLRNYLAATSVGLVGGEALLDLDYQEDSRAEVDMNLVMTGDGRYVEIQATAETQPFDDEQSRELLRLGRRGIREIMDLQHELLQLPLPRFA